MHTLLVRPSLPGLTGNLFLWKCLERQVAGAILRDNLGNVPKFGRGATLRKATQEESTIDETSTPADSVGCNHNAATAANVSEAAAVGV